MQREYIVRICSTCDKPLNFKTDGTQEGIIWGDEYYHEGACVEAHCFDGMTWAEQYDFLGGDDQEEAYWTEWELELAEVTA